MDMGSIFDVCQKEQGIGARYMSTRRRIVGPRSCISASAHLHPAMPIGLYYK